MLISLGAFNDSTFNSPLTTYDLGEPITTYDLDERIDNMIKALNIFEDPIRNITFNYEKGITTVVWSDGDVTMVKAHNEPFDEEKALGMAWMKHYFDNRYDYIDRINDYIKDARKIGVVSKPKTNKYLTFRPGEEITFTMNNATISEDVWKDMCGEGTNFEVTFIPKTEDLTDDDWDEILEEEEKSEE